MAVNDLLDLLHGLANWPEAPRGRDGPARRAVDWLAAALAAALSAATLLGFLVAAVTTRPWAAFVELAKSFVILAMTGAVGLFLLHLAASLIAVGVDRLTARK